MSQNVLVRYNGTAVGSSESFKVDQYTLPIFPVEDRALFRPNEEIPNYGNPIEPYHVLLDGSVVPVPQEREDINMGLWTEKPIGNDMFGIMLTSSEGLFSIAGITITFDDVKGIFPTAAMFIFSREGEIINMFAEEIEAGQQSFPMFVEFFDSVEIDFATMNIPDSRLWIKRIDFGLVTEFESKDLRNAKETFSINPIALTLPVNTFSMTVVAPEDITFMFERTQSLEVYFNGKLQSVNFITSATRRSERIYDVEAEDYIGVLDSATFAGGFYRGFLKAKQLIRKICEAANVPVSFDENFKDQDIWGYLPYSSCREALQQVLFVCGATAITSESKTLRIVNLSSSKLVVVDKNRILRSPSLEVAQRVTAVEVTSHAYRQKKDDYYTIFDSEVNIVDGKNVTVIFPEPLHSLDIYDGRIIESGDNYATFYAGENCFFEGQRYEHLTRVHTRYNPLVLSSDIENVKQVGECTLVTPENVDNVLNVCYNYFTTRTSRSVSLRIAEKLSDKGEAIGNPISLGNSVSIDTEITNGAFRGRAEQQKYSLNGGILVKETMIR